MRKTAYFAVLLAPAIIGCAKQSSEITASYVSPYQFEQLSCQQLGDEAGRLSARAAALAGEQDSKATRDAVATGVAIVVFWPAAFFVRGNDTQTAELARMRGEMEAIEQVSNRKRCSIKFERPNPPVPHTSPRT